MNLHDKVAVVTGGAHGIGRALSRRFAAEGARGVVVADADADGASEVAREIGGLAVRTDVALEREVVELVGQTMNRYGRLDLFCSNAGIFIPGGVDVANSDWRRIWHVNVNAHLYAARAVLPHMLDRRQGYLLAVVSAAGLLTQIGSAPYSVTKHAALALAEWLAVTHGDAGIKVSCLCPQGVAHRDARIGARRRGGPPPTGSHFTRAMRGSGGRWIARGEVLNPAAPGRCQILPAQSKRLRPLAPWDAQAAAKIEGSSRFVMGCPRPVFLTS